MHMAAVATVPHNAPEQDALRSHGYNDIQTIPSTLAIKVGYLFAPWGN